MPQGVWINVTPHPTADWIARQIAVRLGRTASPKDRLIDPTRVPRPCDRLGRGAPTRDSASLCPLLQRFENAPIVGQRRAILAPGSADRSHQVACCSPVHASLSFRYTQVGGAPTFWAPEGCVTHNAGQKRGPKMHGSMHMSGTYRRLCFC